METWPDTTDYIIDYKCTGAKASMTNLEFDSKTSTSSLWKEKLGTGETKLPKHKSKPLYHSTSLYWQIGALVGCFFANVISGGIASCFGVLYTYMQEPLGVSEYQLSWIGSLQGGFHGFFSVVAAVLIDSRGCRITTLLGPVLVTVGLIISSQSSNIYVLYVTLGILPGIGACLSYNATSVHLAGQFTKWRPMAAGISVAGGGLGMMTFPLLISGLSDIMGWRGALLILAGLVLHLVPCALWIKPNQTTGESSPDKTSLLKCITNYLLVFRIKGTRFMFLTYTFIGLSYSTFLIFIPPLIMSTTSMTSTDAAFMISLAGFGSLVGRMVFAGASQVHEKAPQIIFTVALCLCGMSLITVPLNKDMTGFLVNGILYGLALGAWSSIASVVFVNFFGLENLSKTFGTTTLCIGIGSMCGPPLQSYLATISGSQELMFYSAGGMYILSALCVLPLMMTRSTVQKSNTCLVISVIGADNAGFTGNNSV